MTGPRPNSPPPLRRRRSAKPLMPWALIGMLFTIYLLIGLMLSVPAPPDWVWIPALLGAGLLTVGLNRPLVPGTAERQRGILAYVGGLLLVMALAVAANFIGSGQRFDDIRFSVLVVGLALLTLLAIALTAAATIVGARTGAQLMQLIDYRQSLSILAGTCFGGLCLGGVAGFLTLTLTGGI